MLTHRKVLAVPFLVWLTLSAGQMSISVAGAGPATGTAASPGDLLGDAYDALDANRVDLARKIFQTLLDAYPRSNEATRAADELANMDAQDGDKADVAPPGESRAVRELAEEEERRAGASVLPQDEQRLTKARMRFLTDVGDRVFFAENSDSLGGRARAVLEGQARWLKTFDSFHITVIGRAADSGSAQDDAQLASARANAVRARLIEDGVAPERIRVETRGRTDPVATCTAPMCAAQNRHVESLLRYPGEEGARVSGADGARSALAR